MIERYIRVQMKALWDPEAIWATRLKVGLAICDAQEAYDYIPKGAAAAIRSKAAFTLDRIAELEIETKHDIMAFVKNVQENVGEPGRWYHFAVTSYDKQDTATCITLRDSCDLILGAARHLVGVIRFRATQHMHSIQIGRTHGIHAEPITFGFKLAGWLDEMNRNIERMEQARKAIAVGKISGPVGTYANLDPRVEAHVCNALGLEPVLHSTQIISRDRHAQLLTTLSIMAASLERFATEIRNLQRTEILEVQEYFAQGQKGSSSMPHKRNPWNCETVSGLARVVRGNVIPALEDMTTWHERDLANSAVERIILPDTCQLVDWMLEKFSGILERLIVYPENMQLNLEKMGGLICSEQVMIALIQSGLSRDDAYTIVQEHAAAKWDKGTDFKAMLMIDPRVSGRIDAAQLEQCFDIDHHLRNLHFVFERLGI